jgi:hypothetical protein
MGDIGAKTRGMGGLGAPEIDVGTGRDWTGFGFFMNSAEMVCGRTDSPPQTVALLLMSMLLGGSM